MSGCGGGEVRYRLSLLYSIFVIWLVPSANAAHSTARCAALLLGGTVAVPPKRLT